MLNAWQVASGLVAALNQTNFRWPSGSAAPPAPTLTHGGVFNLPGTYRFAISYVGSDGSRTPISPLSNALTCTSIQAVSIALNATPPAGTATIALYVTDPSNDPSPLWFVGNATPAQFPVIVALNTQIFSDPFADPTKLATGAGSPVLGRAAVTTQPATFNALDQVAPSVLVRAERSAAHPEHPADFDEESRFTVTLYALNATDQAGGAAVIGGNRAGAGQSGGRGLLEVEPLVRAQLINAFATLGIRPRVVSAPATVPEALQGLLAARAYEGIATRLPVLPAYDPASLVAATIDAGDVTVTFDLPLARYDLAGFTWVRTAGSTPASSPVGGTFVAGTGSTFTDTPGSGTWTYSVFAAYDAWANPFTGAASGSAPNAWSGSQAARGAFTYQPAWVTVVV